MPKGKSKQTYASIVQKPVINQTNTQTKNTLLESDLISSLVENNKNYLFTYVSNVPSTNSTFNFTKEKSEKLFDLMVELLNIVTEDYQTSFSVSAQELFFHYATIENKIKEHQLIEEHNLIKESLNQLLTIVKQTHLYHFQNCDIIKDKQKISYGEYKKILLSTKYVSIKIGKGQQIGGYIQSCTEETFESFGKKVKYLNISYTTITYDGSNYIKINKFDQICEFGGKIEINDLLYLPITLEEILQFHNRGKIYHKYAKNDTFNYLHYTGSISVPVAWWTVEHKAIGRIIIDINTHKYLFPNEYPNGYNSNKLKDNLSYFDYCHLPPDIQAFSFEAKKWGKILLENIEPIVWDDTSYDKLVLDTTKKNILKTLVLNTKNSFKDIVKGKSGGCIFLLHGTPGTGKTLTAETISETLHKPLYCITSGELGTDVIQVETKLSQILEMTQRWDAIILIDEADVFLEKRDTQNLVRNAIVCVFLRLLEKYNGIMFLTTNRKTELDYAFQSRISLILEYNDLNYENRLKVWNSLLSSAKINLEETYINDYAKFITNGRNIKNIIRLANSLAIGNEEETSNKHFDEIFSLYIQEYKLVKEYV